MIEKEKSRSIPFVDFYQNLQLEFLSYYFRMLIYDESFKDKYLDFCQKKKITICKISLKKSLPDIFKDESYRIKYLNKFFHNEGFGLPNFQYRDEHQKQHLGYWDKKGYFKTGVSVIYNNNKYEIVRNICNFEDPLRDCVIIKKHDQNFTLKVRISEIKREWDFNSIKLDQL